MSYHVRTMRKQSFFNGDRYFYSQLALKTNQRKKIWICEVQITTSVLFLTYFYAVYILHDPSCRMTKPIYRITHVHINVKKRFVYFQCPTISLCKAFTVLIFKYDIDEYRNEIKTVSSLPFPL